MFHWELFDRYPHPRSPRRLRRLRLLRVKQATANVTPAGRYTHARGPLERLAAPPRQQALRACELAQIGFASPSGWLCQAGMSRGRRTKAYLSQIEGIYRLDIFGGRITRIR